MATKAADIEGMQKALPFFADALGDTNQAYGSMSDQQAALAASWRGDAAMGFRNALQQWLENCKKVQEQLQIVTEKLEASTGNYVNIHTDTVDQATEIRNAVSAGLPGF
ncbi:WXG100 family type VII secretion target [Streptomyces sp. LBL]|uniref:WXG100 family type VII secretion target n=1 Tax=Streptomyces sp. LBL TaxID=2940562 RepID=UPI0024764014|nr:WXG100 family type VII secretion target [Streptomyces sp. LBL]MDH6630476.1 WXG100 family type VII secretion target [Streptomyces sp. LBL]